MARAISKRLLSGTTMGPSKRSRVTKLLKDRRIERTNGSQSLSAIVSYEKNAVTSTLTCCSLRSMVSQTEVYATAREMAKERSTRKKEKKSTCKAPERSCKEERPRIRHEE